MKKTPLVSVIVPIYNAEAFLPKCLDSILAQTLNQIEIICVNDGSTDESRNILKKYAEKNEQIRILDKENGGLVSARKAGVSVATGMYVGFVDADDWIEAGMYERLYHIASQHNADIVTSGYIQEGNYISVGYDNIAPGVYTENRMDYLRNNTIFNLEKCDKGICASLCFKLFKAEIMKNIIYQIPNDITTSEDRVTSLTFLLHCRRAAVLHEAYYHYVMHHTSMMHSVDTNYLMRLNTTYQYLISLYSHPNFSDKMRVQVELYITQFAIKGINTWLGFKNHNLMWIDSYWMDYLPEGSKVAIYGAGDLGMKYYQQITASKKLTFSGCVDFGYERMKGFPFDVWNPTELLHRSYDVLVITIKNSAVADEVKTRLISLGIKEESIRWFEQKEIFWKFAKADGLLD